MAAFTRVARPMHLDAAMAPHAPQARELRAPVAAQAKAFARRHWRMLCVLLALTVSFGVVTLRPIGEAAERRALQRMSQADRQALYEEVFRSTQSLCAHSATATNAALRDQCVQSARFLRAFPECDDACRRLARAQEPGPTR